MTMSAIKIFALVIVFNIFYPMLSWAANISVDDKSRQLPAIEISGEIKYGDEKKFHAIAINYEHAEVVLDSGGGALEPALEIGRTIRLREYPTVVPSNAVCASACALMWVAGQKRVLFEGGQIGFHASYQNKNGELIATGVGNALVGRYLTQLGYGEQTIVFATTAAPSQILWLTTETAAKSGIEFEMRTPDSDTRAHGGGKTARSAGPNPASKPQGRVAPPSAPMVSDLKQPIRNIDVFVRELKKYGYNGRLVMMDGRPYIIMSIFNKNISIVFSHCEENNCAEIGLLHIMDDMSERDVHRLTNEWMNDINFSSLLLMKERDKLTVYHLIILGESGITIDNLIENIQEFVIEIVRADKIASGVK